MKILDFQKAVLLEQAIILNGLLAHGTPAEKAIARKKWDTLQEEIHQVLTNRQSQPKDCGEMPFLV